MSLLRAIALPVVILSALTNCSTEDKKKDPDATETGCSTQVTASAATFDQLWSNVFSKQCGTCHGVDSNSQTVGGPDLRTAAKFYEALVDKTGNDYADWETYQKNRVGCLDYSFIKAGAATDSVVLAILDTSTSLSGCTVASHLDAPQSICLTDANKTKLKEWIDAGAQR